VVNYYKHQGDSILDCADQIRGRLFIDGHVYVVMEPGDATRYEFFFANMGGELLCSIIGPETSNCCVLMPTQFVDKGYLASKICRKDLNYCTLALFCEMINRVNGVNLVDRYFNFTIGRAV
jgi:hypothetical protein